MRIVVLVFLFLVNQSSIAQKIEIGTYGGIVYFLGDLGGNRGKGTIGIKDINLPLVTPIFGCYASFEYNYFIRILVSASIGELKGNDQNIINHGGAELFRKKRNLSFKSSFQEIMLLSEVYNPNEQPILNFHIIIGVGIMHFNPRAELNGKWIALQPLHLEGQGFPEYGRKNYKLVQPMIPVGVGIKYFFSTNGYIGIDFLYRKLFTDYIDDVSTTYINPDLFDKYLPPDKAKLATQLYYRGNPLTPPKEGDKRGNPSNKDTYLSVIFKIGIKITKNRTQLKCPKI
jgi:hypothetical protein